MSASQEDRKRFHMCLDIGFEIMDLLESGGQPIDVPGATNARVLGSEIVMSAIKLHHDMEFTDEQVDMTGHMLEAVVSQYGMTTCAAWAIAHNIEHIMFDPEFVKS